MFARRISAAIRPGGLDDIVDFIEEVGAPEVTQQPGFMGGILMSNTNADEVVALTFWESEAAMAATENTDEFNKRISKAAHLLASPRMIEHFDVRVQFGKIFSG